MKTSQFHTLVKKIVETNIGQDKPSLQVPGQPSYNVTNSQKLPLPQQEQYRKAAEHLARKLVVTEKMPPEQAKNDIARRFPNNPEFTSLVVQAIDQLISQSVSPVGVPSDVPKPTSPNQPGVVGKSEPDLFNEAQSEASQQAHELGLIYAGYGRWKDDTGAVVARTIRGKLVKVGDPEPNYTSDDPRQMDLPMASKMMTSQELQAKVDHIHIARTMARDILKIAKGDLKTAKKMIAQMDPNQEWGSSADQLLLKDMLKYEHILAENEKSIIRVPKRIPDPHTSSRTNDLSYMETENFKLTADRNSYGMPVEFTDTFQNIFQKWNSSQDTNEFVNDIRDMIQVPDHTNIELSVELDPLGTEVKGDTLLATYASKSDTIKMSKASTNALNSLKDEKYETLATMLNTPEKPGVPMESILGKQGWKALRDKISSVHALIHEMIHSKDNRAIYDLLKTFDIHTKEGTKGEFLHRQLIEGLTETRAIECTWSCFSKAGGIPSKMMRTITNQTYYAEQVAFRNLSEFIPTCQIDLWKIPSVEAREQYVNEAFTTKVLPQLEAKVPGVAKLINDKFSGNYIEFLIKNSNFNTVMNIVNNPVMDPIEKLETIEIDL